MTSARALAPALAEIARAATVLGQTIGPLVNELADDASGLHAAGYEPHAPLAAHSDPTAAAAVSPPASALALDALDAAISQAHRAMVAADAIRRAWLGAVDPVTGRPAAVPRVAAGDDLLWCRSCIRDNAYCEPAGDRGLCRWCRSFERKHGTLPPRRLLARRHRGQRISTGDVERELARAGITHS